MYVIDVIEVVFSLYFEQCSSNWKAFLTKVAYLKVIDFFQINKEGNEGLTSCFSNSVEEEVFGCLDINSAGQAIHINLNWKLEVPVRDPILLILNHRHQGAIL